MEIKGAVLHGPHQDFQIETLNLQEPQAGEVLVRVTAAGICHSDYHLITGDSKHPMPVLAGHEGAGKVEAVGSGVSRVSVGDQVALNWAPFCGDCFYCIEGQPQLCSTYEEALWSGVMLDDTTRLSSNGDPVYHFSGVSCFAEFAVLPEQCCIVVDGNVPPAIVALTGCAVTTGVGSVLNTAQVKPGSTVAVFGAGGVGLSVLMGAQLAGAKRIIAIDRAESKIEIVKYFGATDFVLAAEDTNEQIRGLTEGRGADYVFEAIGIPAVQEQALDATRPGGTLILVGIAPMGSGTNMPGALLTRQEKTVAGSFYGSANTARDFPLYLDLYSSGRLPIDKLVTKTYELEQINEGFAAMLSGEIARGVILFD